MRLAPRDLRIGELGNWRFFFLDARFGRTAKKHIGVHLEQLRRRQILPRFHIVDAAHDEIARAAVDIEQRLARNDRSEEHTSELQSLMRISYAVFCLKKKNNT